MEPTEIKNRLKVYGFKPKDYLGQNFLIDEEALEEIVAAADLNKSDTVLEVGPGLGFLTTLLAQNTKKVIAVEKDHRLIGVLRAELSSFKNVDIIQEDILRYNFNQIPAPYKVVANIPYYLTSKLIANLLSSENKPSMLVLLVQKEVGERIVAEAGELSILGLSVQFYSDAKIVSPVLKDSFWPKPEVDSAIIKIIPRNKFNINEKTFFRLIKIAFAGKRKQLHNTIASGLKLSKEEAQNILKNAEIDPFIRPQELKLEDWVRLAQSLDKK
ncbi:MAG TPA: 16S rRNA (adenine(1518)-N(6)/adenine(1519)-N(6))-dimethyltransferase RsmA [Verrucomicrobiae bacterium]|nr:16S rRNA (adenine(1518)-N(6)/adenine(1519)-N(6))-dimethyltransferase RsmA [Verrucomicrobiae bacterium]